MPLFSSQLQLNTAASASGTPLADIAAIKGAFKVYDTYSGMTSTPVSLVSNKQIVWCEELEELFQATVTPANYITTFEDTVVWATFNGFGGGGSGTGDITAVLAGNGLTGGGTSGTIVMNVGAGNGISVSADAVSLNTGSLHFQQGVENIISSGSYIIDLGNI